MYLNMTVTAREIITARLNHEGTDITPYEVHFEKGIHDRLAVHYGNDWGWVEKKLRSFTCSFLNVDTIQMEYYDQGKKAIDAYGVRWNLEAKMPHGENIPVEEPSLTNYKFPTLEKFLNPVLEKKQAAIKSYNEENEKYRMINMGWGIFENSWRICGFENSLMYMLTDEDFYKELTTKLTDIYVALVKECTDVPADAFLFGDDWGDQRGVIMGDNTWRKFLKPCWERIFNEVHKQGKKTICHSCGSISAIYDDLAEIGLDCHESVQPEAYGMAPEIVKEKWGNKMCFWGCIGSQGLLSNGTPQEIRAEVFRLHELFKKDGGYVMAPAKPLSEEMDLDKAIALIEALSELPK